MLSVPGHNFNHFTGKTGSFRSRKRRKKMKCKRVHRNKYASAKGWKVKEESKAKSA